MVSAKKTVVLILLRGGSDRCRLLPILHISANADCALPVVHEGAPLLLGVRHPNLLRFPLCGKHRLLRERMRSSSHSLY